jgi:transportin-3
VDQLTVVYVCRKAHGAPSLAFCSLRLNLRRRCLLRSRFAERFIYILRMTVDRHTDSLQITYDLATQVPPSELASLRNQILLLLKHFAAGPKPIRVQLCVCLAILAIQMKEWDDVLPSVVQALSGSPQSHACILDFLRVLPEEVTEGRKITLSVRGTNHHTQLARNWSRGYRERSTSARNISLIF